MLGDGASLMHPMLRAVFRLVLALAADPKEYRRALAIMNINISRATRAQRLNGNENAAENKSAAKVI
jgi:hypothetical protein